MLSFTILGEPASKSNSRQKAKDFRRTVNGKPNRNYGGVMWRKSDKAIAYKTAVRLQAPAQRPLLEGDLSLTAWLFYASRRPDLDASVLLDALQGKVYENDRQIRELHLYHSIDKANPRAEVTVEQRK